MHPFYSLLASEVWQADRRREAEQWRRFPRPVAVSRHLPLRARVGYRLVEVGLRMAVRGPAVSR